jgi:hypothetical protein
MLRQIAAGVKPPKVADAWRYRRSRLRLDSGALVGGRAFRLAPAPRSIVHQQMVLSAKLTVNGDHRPVDITDKTVSKNHVRDFPVPALPDIWKSAHAGNARRFASRLTAKRFVCQLLQFRMVLSNRRHRRIQSRRADRSPTVTRIIDDRALPARGRALRPSRTYCRRRTARDRPDRRPGPRDACCGPESAADAADDSSRSGATINE